MLSSRIYHRRTAQPSQAAPLRAAVKAKTGARAETQATVRALGLRVGTVLARRHGLIHRAAVGDERICVAMVPGRRSRWNQPGDALGLPRGWRRRSASGTCVSSSAIIVHFSSAGGMHSRALSAAATPAACPVAAAVPVTR